MKNIFLLFFALIIMPAWAGDKTDVATIHQDTAQTATTNNATMDEGIFVKDSPNGATTSGKSTRNYPPPKLIPAACPTGCARMTCTGVTSCFRKGCGAC